MNHKKSYQEGSVRKRGNKYYYRFRMEEPDGTMKMHEFVGTESKRETENMLKKAVEEYNELGKILDPGDITVSELMDEWFRTEIEPSSRATTTLDIYRNVMDHVRAHRIGKMKLKEVTVEALQAYVDEKYFGEYDEEGSEIKHAYSDSTMKEEFVVLNGIFKYAVYPKEYLKSSPMQHVKKRKKPEETNIFGDESEKLEIITHDEYKRIIEFLSTHKNSYGDDYRYMILPVQISYYTGLRAGELAGLCWDDVDIPGRRLIVRRSMFKDTGTKSWELKAPKNRKQRVVDYGETLANILMEAKTQQENDRKLYGDLYQKHYCQTQSIKGRPHNIVFTDIHTDTGIIGSRVGHGKLLEEAEKGKSLVPLEFVCRKVDGELVTIQTLKNCNKLVQTNLGITWFHMHGLRHTYGSNMIASGANYKDVQLLMGHSDIGITLNTYVHPNEKTRKTAVDLLEKSLG